jgi:putative glutamine amidotransferase
VTAGSGSHGSDRPVVAVVAYHLADDRVPRWPQGGYGVPAPYIDAVRRSGARTGIVSPGEPGPPEATLERYDGLLLVGGGDVDPARYGADRDAAHVYGVEPDRDDFELDLLPAAERLALPTLCICRGMQVMNVAYGGTLHQHLPDLPGLLEHGVPIEGTETRHPVTLEPSSTLAAATQQGEIMCSSHHHQGIDRLGARLRISGRSPDGLVEGIELDGSLATGSWIVGVQWHPEETAHEDPAQRSFFDALVLRSRDRRSGSRSPAG